MTNRVEAGPNHNVLMSNLVSNTKYSFYAVSYDANGVESAPSETISYRPPAISQIKLSVTANRTSRLEFRAAPGTVCRVERSASLEPAQWESIGSGTADADGAITLDDSAPADAPMQFYRAVEP